MSSSPGKVEAWWRRGAEKMLEVGGGRGLNTDGCSSAQGKSLHFDYCVYLVKLLEGSMIWYHG